MRKGRVRKPQRMQDLVSFQTSETPLKTSRTKKERSSNCSHGHKEYEEIKSYVSSFGENGSVTRNEGIPSSCMSQDQEDDWMMQTSRGYEYDLQYEQLTTYAKDTAEGNDAKIYPLTKREENQRVTLDKSENESREERIRHLKSLVRKQEKVLYQLKSKNGNPEKPLQVTTECSRLTKPLLLMKPQRKPKKNPTHDIPVNDNTRDVDIFMRRGDEMTKDEFLAVLGLVRVAKFHE